MIPIEKQLHNEGIEFNSVWWWVEHKYLPENQIKAVTSSVELVYFKNLKTTVSYFAYPAPTVAELGEKLKPSNIKHKLPYWFEEGKYWCTVIHIRNISYVISENTEADARAEMLLYLKRMDEI